MMLLMGLHGEIIAMGFEDGYDEVYNIVLSVIKF